MIISGRHTFYFYEYILCCIYDFKYILTAANRWSKRQIDDFILILDLGKFETIQIPQTFFQDKEDWHINGEGKIRDHVRDDNSDREQLRFYIQSSNVIFTKKNFHPTGELYFSEPANYFDNNYRNNKQKYLPFSIENEDEIDLNMKLDKKIIRNLPFARRGYVFKDLELKKFYEHIDWYTPNTSYIPNISSVDEREKKWLKKLN